MPSVKLISLSLALATFAAARTDLGGCTSSVTGNRYIYYVPGTGEICDIPDCGGGRAPPITTNPACANYKGTATYAPSFLPGFTGAAAASQTSAVQAPASTSTVAAVSQISDGQPQAPSAAPSSAPTSTVTLAPVSQITDGQPQAPKSTSAPAPSSSVPAVVSDMTSVPVQKPTSTAAAVSQITDGQVQAPTVVTSTAVAVSPQAPTTLASTMVTSASNVTAPASGTSRAPVATFTGAAALLGFNKEVTGLAIGVVAGLAML